MGAMRPTNPSSFSGGGLMDNGVEGATPGKGELRIRQRKGWHHAQAVALSAMQRLLSTTCELVANLRRLR